MNNIKWCLLLAGLLLGAPAWGQNNLTGKVTGRYGDGSSENLVGATLYWQGTSTGTLTDDQGKFELKRAAGRDQLIVRYSQWPEDTLRVSPDQTELDIVLRAPTKLDTVQITSRLKSSSFSRIDPFGVELIRQDELRKAACCNLSESFETNPSVDVAFSDAITGTRQIRMLGLSGQYVNITNENMPLLHGLATVDGLGYIPGPWIRGIQLSKGAGTVVNGFEAIAGQINLAYRDPFDEEVLHLNGYVNQAGRVEGNLAASAGLGPKLRTNLLLHANDISALQDRNGDSFLDMPQRTMYTGMNRWKYEADNGLCAQVNLSGVYQANRGGQLDFIRDQDQPANWGYTNDVRRGQAFAKIGWFSPKNPLWSVGTQWMALYHDQNSRFERWVYDGTQRSFYTNIIGQMPLGKEDKHLLKAGFSYQTDDYDETVREFQLPQAFNQVERVPGVFTELTFSPSKRMDLVLGLRSDWHNVYGQFWTPRLNLRYDFTQTTVLRLAGGRGQRTPRPLSENFGLLASNRRLNFTPSLVGPNIGYGFPPEIGWNFGLSLTQDFFLDFREGTVRAEFYRTDFRNQLVVDREVPGELSFYVQPNLSFANSFLIEASYEVIQRLDLRLAYRYYDLRQSYRDGTRQPPFNPRHRGFANLAYRTRLHGWSFDLTWQAVGPQRIPDTGGLRPEQSPAYSLVNAQVAKEFGKRWEIYLGGENLTNYRQDNPIISPTSTSAPEFDATMIWAPVFGRNIYGGFRYTVRKKPA